MSFRLIEMMMPKEYRKDALVALEGQSVIESWSESVAEGRVRINGRQVVIEHAGVPNNILMNPAYEQSRG